MISCFGDPLAETIEDTVHSKDEERLITIGLSANEQLLVVCHTYRDEVIRIISARRATKTERKFHETA
ncbi:MAG: BrnT family toxin [Candidatus Sumerlaeaceae bacterium]